MLICSVILTQNSFPAAPPLPPPFFFAGQSSSAKRNRHMSGGDYRPNDFFESNHKNVLVVDELLYNSHPCGEDVESEFDQTPNEKDQLCEEYRVESAQPCVYSSGTSTASFGSRLSTPQPHCFTPSRTNYTLQAFVPEPMIPSRPYSCMEEHIETIVSAAAQAGGELANSITASIGSRSAHMCEDAVLLPLHSHTSTPSPQPPIVSPSTPSATTCYSQGSTQNLLPYTASNSVATLPASTPTPVFPASSQKTTANYLQRVHQREAPSTSTGASGSPTSVCAVAGGMPASSTSSSSSYSPNSNPPAPASIILNSGSATPLVAHATREPVKAFKINNLPGLGNSLTVADVLRVSGEQQALSPPFPYPNSPPGSTGLLTSAAEALAKQSIPGARSGPAAALYSLAYTLPPASGSVLGGPSWWVNVSGASSVVSSASSQRSSPSSTAPGTRPDTPHQPQPSPAIRPVAPPSLEVTAASKSTNRNSVNGGHYPRGTTPTTASSISSISSRPSPVPLFCGGGSPSQSFSVDGVIAPSRTNATVGRGALAGLVVPTVGGGGRGVSCSTGSLGSGTAIRSGAGVSGVGVAAGKQSGSVGDGAVGSNVFSAFKRRGAVSNGGLEGAAGQTNRVIQDFGKLALH